MRKQTELQCGHFDWEKCSCTNNSPLSESVRASQDVMTWKEGAGIPSYARQNDEEICGFFGEYRWLSNFFIVYVYYGGKRFPSTEHAFQYAKLSPEYDREGLVYEEVCKMSAGQVKRWASAASFEKLGFKLRPDWEQVKYDIMLSVVFDKFFRHRDLRQKLIATGNRYLEETNSWRDKTWGVCNGIGTNWLGKISMKVRECWKPENLPSQSYLKCSNDILIPKDLDLEKIDFGK